MNKIKYLTLCLILSVIYFLAAKLGLTFAFAQANVSPIWPPTGLAIAAVLFFGYQIWPAIFFAALAINLATSTPLIAATGIATGNTLEAVVGGFLILKFIGHYPFDSIKTTLTFSALILLATTISATLGVVSLLLTSVIDTQQMVLLWSTWWFGDAAGGLVFTPLLLTLLRKPRFVLNKTRGYELAALLACIALSTVMVFNPTFSGINGHHTFAFFLIPTIVWAALRFYQHGATAVIVFYSLAATYCTIQGVGPFVVADTNASLLLLQGFIAIMVVTVLTLSASVDETKRIEAQLHQTQNNLRQLVTERTQALNDTHKALNKAADHRKATDESMRKLLQASALPSNEQYLHNISKELAKIYHTQYAFIGVFSNSQKTSIRTLSVFSGDQHIDNFCYELYQTPCQDVLDLKMEFIEQDVAQLYPNDQLLVQMNIESYFGTPIIAPDNQILGIIVVMDTKPMQVDNWVAPILSLIANRVSFEIERDIANQELKLAASVFKETAEAIIICDAKRRIVRVNPAFSQITGYSAKETIGQTPSLFISGKHPQIFYESFWQAIDQTGSWQGEMWDKRKNGEIFPVWQTITAVCDQQGQVKQYISVFNDITSQKHAEEQIYHLAHFDILTGLPNRSLFIEQLQLAMEKAQREQQSLALLFMDLDHFKLINDSADHCAGDILLTQVAERLRKFVNDKVIISRLGGDEFTILIKNVEDDHQIKTLAQKILTQMSTPFKLDAIEVMVSASIGYCSYPKDAESAYELLKNADIAMYKAKEAGSKKYQRYHPQMNGKAQQRLQIEQELRIAIKEEQFVLHYQPQVQLSSHQVIGCEALVRWDHPQKGLLGPAYFIDIAEQSGLIVPLGNWILEAACLQFIRWQQQGINLAHVAVNLSARQFINHDLEKAVIRVLDKTGMNPSQLELELTESMLMENVEQTIDTMNRLKTMGIQLSIDDFGTGYSSMAYLKHFPIDKLKIDKSFINGLPNTSQDAAIVNSTISLAHGLGLTVIAEGVETAQQLNYLKAHACEEIQGYYFSIPYPGDDPRLHRKLEQNGLSGKRKSQLSQPRFLQKQHKPVLPD